MPNWFSGLFTITGTKEQMKPIYDWTQIDDVLDEDDEGFNKLVPLPTPNGEWDYDLAYDFWGSKWGVHEVHHIYATETRIEIQYQSAWSAPTGLFYQLEKKYGVSVSAEGAEQEGCRHICLYENGKFIIEDYDIDCVVEWADDGDLKKEEDFDDEYEWYDYQNEIVDDYIHEYLQEKYEEMRADMSKWENYVPKVKIEEKIKICPFCDKKISPDMKTGTAECSSYGKGNWTKKCCWDCSDQKHDWIEKKKKELTEKLTKQRKETKDFLKMIEKTDISAKMATTKDEEHGDCWEGRKCQEDEFGHCVVCCECRKCL